MSDKWTPPNIYKEKKRHRWVIDDKPSCENAIMSGVLIGCLLSAFTFSLVGYNYIVGFTNDALANAATTDSLFDVVLFLVFSFLTYKKSRIASSLLLILYGLEFLSKFSDGGGPRGVLLIWDVLMLACFTNACRGTFLWHAKYKKKETITSVTSTTN